MSNIKNVRQPAKVLVTTQFFENRQNDDGHRQIHDLYELL